MHHPSTPFPEKQPGGSLQQAAGPAQPRSITALVSPCFKPATRLLPRPEQAAAGDIVCMTAGHFADFEQLKGLQRVLEGFHVQTADGPAFRFYEQIPDDEGCIRMIASRLALEYLYLAPTLHGIVLDHGLAPSSELYRVQAVTFADARLLFWPGMLTDSTTHDPCGWEEAPDMQPLFVEVSYCVPVAEALALAARRVDLFRRLLPAGVDFDVEIAGYALV